MIRINMRATGENIKQRCDQANITPTDLSRYLNINLATPYYWFQGKVLPRWETAFNLAELLQCQLTDLFVLEEGDE